MGHLSRFPGTSIDEDRDALRHDLAERMENSHKRIASVIEKLTEEAWCGIAMPDAADETDVEMAEERARLMERNVVLQLGWLAGAR